MAMLTAAFMGGSASAAEVVPVLKGGILGGQYFLQGARGNLSGNANALAAPVVKFSERWSFIPMYAANYQGTKGTDDGTAAGTLFQQEMDHRVSATGIYTADGSHWRLKPAASYKREFLKQTTDERWGRGLFDFEKIAAGFEAENVYKDPFSYRIGVDVFRIRFPNYQSLESAAGTDPSGNPLNRELSDKNVLDTYNYQLSFSGARPFPYDDPKVSLQMSFSSLYRHYSDQHLVNLQGQLQSRGREDFLQTLSLGVGYPRQVRLWGNDCRLNSSLSASLSHNGSNQNSFDAAQTRFIFDAYSYYSYGLGPSFSLAWGDSKSPASVGLSFLYSRVQYTGRLAQDASGVYLPRHQYQDRYTATLGYSYPIAPGFNLKAQANFLWAASNQVYQTTYLYTYRTGNYLMGFTYDY